MITASVSDPDEKSAPFSDANLPGLFRSADLFSIRRQKLFIWAVGLRFTFLVFAAVSGVTSVRLSGSEFEWAALGTGLLLFLTLAIEVFVRVSGPENDWYDGRVLAESAKTLAWRYAVGAHPFSVLVGEDAGAGEAAEREATVRRDFLAEVQNLLSDVPDIGEPADTVAVVTPWMTHVRISPLQQRQATYVRYRILDQQSWYAKKAADNRRNQTRLWTAVLAAEGLALLASALRFGDVMSTDLAGVAVSLIAAGTGWLGVRQYATLHRSYSFAAQDLAIVRARLEMTLNEEEWAAEAADAEESISREHTLWRSSRSSRFNRQPGVV